MRKMNLKSVDLNLLVALKALLDEKHVSRAAIRVGLSQPAMSRALCRLRKIFHDALLVRSASGLCLTARASELQQPLQQVLTEIQHILLPPSQEPAEMSGEVTIAARDYEIATVLPRVIQYIIKHAPYLKVSIISLTGDHLDLLEKQEVDFILSATESHSSILCRKALFQDDFVCLVSDSNLVVHQEFTLDQFLDLKHCMITISGFGPGIVDLELAKKHVQRDVVVRTSQFLCVSHLIANSNLVVTLPRRMGQLLSQQANIKLLEVPIFIEPFSIFLYWHVKNQTNPIHQWIRQTVFSGSGFSH